MRYLRHIVTLVPTTILALWLQTADAAAGAIDIVSPVHADALASPLTFRLIQTDAEADSELSPSAVTQRPPAVRAGLNTYMSGRNQTYDIPVRYAFTPNLHGQLDIPLVTATTVRTMSGSFTETGLGDINLSVKLKVNLDALLDFYYIFSAKLPTGKPEKGLGTGSYDFSFTHKTVTMFSDYRTTFMLGVTIPPPIKVTVIGSQVEYGPTISYMVATERALASTGLRFGLKAAGLHAFNAKIDTLYQKNALTTLDIIPEATYKISDCSGVSTGIILPLLTIYELPEASSRRSMQLNINYYRHF